MLQHTCEACRIDSGILHSARDSVRRLSRMGLEGLRKHGATKDTIPSRFFAQDKTEEMTTPGKLLAVGYNTDAVSTSARTARAPGCRAAAP